MLLSDLFKRSNELLSKTAINNPALETRIMLKHVLDCQDHELVLNFDSEVKQEQIDLFERLLQQRLDHMPIAYITGKREFYGREFIVSSDVLIPRPDSEILIDAVINKYKHLDQNLYILDLGTGSGALILTLCLELPNSAGLAVDVSKAALEIAKANSTKLAAKNVNFIYSDWFSNLPKQRFDIIVCNPPYIAKDSQELALETQKHEPSRALFADNNGLADYQKIAKKALDYLQPNGEIYLEIGYDQAGNVRDIFMQQNYQYIASYHDLSGLERCLIFKAAN